MGDGEAGGCGVEISGNVTISVEILKNSQIPVPFVESDQKAITIATAETLEQAANIAVKMMLNYLISCKKMNSDLAWQLISTVSEVCICQFANKLKTVRCEIPQKYL